MESMFLIFIVIIGLVLFRVFGDVLVDKLLGNSPLESLGLAIAFVIVGYVLYKTACKLWGK
jgi:hypothetical protein